MWKDITKEKPTEYGKYEVYRKGCKKQHYETWNNTGWAYNNNDITHWRVIVSPLDKIIQVEKILCSAIHFNDGKEYSHQPVNITEGFVVFGMRHHNCYAILSAIAKAIDLEERIRLMIDKADRDQQGFLTTKNRYVDRIEGFRIALANNQLLHPNLYDASNPKQELCSEDIF